MIQVMFTLLFVSGIKNHEILVITLLGSNIANSNKNLCCTCFIDEKTVKVYVNFLNELYYKYQTSDVYTAV